MRTRLLFGPLAALGLAALAAVSGVFGDSTPAPPPERVPVALGGATSRASAGEDSFALPAATLAEADRARFFAGQRLFNIGWIKAPAGFGETEGLGPTFNRPSCGACHTRDGRGAPPDGPDDALMQSLVRVSVTVGRRDDARAPPLALPPPHPRYGRQLNDRAIEDVPAEGRAEIAWEDIEGRYGDGEAYRLRRPRIVLKDLAFGDGGEKLLLSLRVAPQLVGLGLLAAIPDRDLEAQARVPRRDGVQGVVPIYRATGAGPDAAPAGIAFRGRLGWRAEEPGLRAQIAGALFEDMGLTSSLHPRANCPPVQAACAAAPPARRQPEVGDDQLDALVFYVSTLAVPMRRDAEAPAVKRGEQVFFDIGCPACHRPRWRTGASASPPAIANQWIFPFTDLLLHDMGAGLADSGHETDPLRRRWRTAPLWGIGLVPAVNGHEFYLHDGRARGLAEAILWHGGAAEPFKERFRTLPKADRDALVAFLKSL